MKPTVYIETTVISYRMAKPSRDLIIAAHQQITHEWWDIALPRFDAFISPIVLEEISKGKKNSGGNQLCQWNTDTNSLYSRGAHGGLTCHKILSLMKCVRSVIRLKQSAKTTVKNTSNIFNRSKRNIDINSSGVSQSQR